MSKFNRKIYFFKNQVKLYSCFHGTFYYGCNVHAVKQHIHIAFYDLFWPSKAVLAPPLITAFPFLCKNIENIFSCVIALAPTCISFTRGLFRENVKISVADPDPFHFGHSDSDPFYKTDQVSQKISQNNKKISTKKSQEYHTFFSDTNF